MPAKMTEYGLLRRRLARYPRYFRVNADSIEMGCAWQDISLCAAMLSRSCLMLEGVTDRDYEFPAASLKHVIRKFDPEGRVFVIYMIGGLNGEALRLRRFKFGDGQLFVHPRDYKEQINRLIEIFQEAELKAQSFRQAV